MLTLIIRTSTRPGSDVICDDVMLRLVVVVAAAVRACAKQLELVDHSGRTWLGPDGRLVQPAIRHLTIMFVFHTVGARWD